MPKPGYKQSEDHKLKRSEALLGNKIPKEVREKISKTLTGRKLSNQHVINMLKSRQ